MQTFDPLLLQFAAGAAVECQIDPPCANCTGVLIQAGIARIVTRAPDPGLAERFRESFAIAQTMRREALVKYEVI